MVLSSAVAGISVALQGLVDSSLVALGITYALLVDVVLYFCCLNSCLWIADNVACVLC